MLLGLVSTSQSALSPVRRGRGRGRANFIQRGGRELAGYAGGGGGGDQGCREGRQEEGGAGAGIDFSGCTEEPDTGLCCIEKEECVTSLEKDPVLECTHKNVEQCHYTYVTQFTPSQEEVCEENFEKICSITFKQQAYNETVEKCYTPVEKVCGGDGPEECRTVFESACTTKYREKSPGKFVADTRCEKLPTKLCGAGCSYQEGPQECHDKVLTSLVDVPQEVCDLNPQKTCRFTTKLVPKLKPEHECTIVPKETCVLKFTTPREVRKPLLTKWCLDPQEPEPGESYEEENAFAPVLSSGSAPQSYGVPPPTTDYSTPTSNYPPPESYGAPTSDSPAPDSYGAPSSDYSAPESYSAPPNGRQPQTGYSVPSGQPESVSSPAGGEYEAPSRGYDGPDQASGPPVYRDYSESYDYNYEEIEPLADIYAVSSPPASPPAQDYNVPAVNARDFSAPTSQPVRDYSGPGSQDSYSAPQLRLRTGRLGRTGGRRQKMMPRRFPSG